MELSSIVSVISKGDTLLNTSMFRATVLEVVHPIRITLCNAAVNQGSITGINITKSRFTKILCRVGPVKNVGDLWLVEVVRIGKLLNFNSNL